MKKYIFSVLMAAMAAFTFSSCEDVPEPYTQIGRASCRERVQISVVAVSLKKKNRIKKKKEEEKKKDKKKLTENRKYHRSTHKDN